MGTWGISLLTIDTVFEKSPQMFHLNFHAKNMSFFVFQIFDFGGIRVQFWKMNIGRSLFIYRYFQTLCDNRKWFRVGPGAFLF